MRKSNNYFKFLEYVTYGKDHDNIIDKGNGVMECKSYVSISDIEDKYKTTFGLENQWLTFKNILINEDTLYVYYLDGENSELVAVYLLDNFKTQKELKDSITTACVEFLYDVLLEKSEVREYKEDQYCEQVHEQLKAKHKPEWHHVKLADIDFDRLDEKRHLYLSLYREIKELLKDLHNCKSGRSYEKRLAKMHSRCADLVYENKVTSDYIRYVTRKVSMCNVECGLWTSANEVSTGYHKSRRYNQMTIRY